MLGLKLPTDPRWVNIAEKNIQEILTDHAFCEIKAASTAISLMVSFPEFTELVKEMPNLAKEEMCHFELVHNIILDRGWTLGRDRKDHYVIKLLSFFPKGGSRTTQLIHRLLYAALIEARSCERFKLLSQRISDPELSKFYYDLMVSEAGHYVTFITFARKYGNGIDVEKRWKELVAFEGEIIKSYGKSETIHG